MIRVCLGPWVILFSFDNFFACMSYIPTPFGVHMLSPLSGGEILIAREMAIVKAKGLTDVWVWHFLELEFLSSFESLCDWLICLYVVAFVRLNYGSLEFRDVVLGCGTLISSSSPPSSSSSHTILLYFPLLVLIWFYTNYWIPWSYMWMFELDVGLGESRCCFSLCTADLAQ